MCAAPAALPVRSVRTFRFRNIPYRLPSSICTISPLRQGPPNPQSTGAFADLQVAWKGMAALEPGHRGTLSEKIADITRQDRLLAPAQQQGALSTLIFLSPPGTSMEQLRAAKLEKETVSGGRGGSDCPAADPGADRSPGGRADFLDAFDGELFRELVDKIIVSNDHPAVPAGQRPGVDRAY